MGGGGPGGGGGGGRPPPPPGPSIGWTYRFIGDEALEAGDQLGDVGVGAVWVCLRELLCLTWGGRPTCESVRGALVGVHGLVG